MSQIPKENVHLGQGVVSFSQSEQGVAVVSSDNNIYHGDILVGADGAYSAVRQHLFRTLKDADSLPASDDVPFPFSSVCLFGQTEVLDPEEFPHLQMEDSQFMSVYGTSCEYSVCLQCFVMVKHEVCLRLYLLNCLGLVVGYLYYKTKPSLLYDRAVLGRGALGSRFIPHL